MADNIINTRIQQRYDSFDNWKNQNPILLVGEVANVRFPDGTVRTKTGNGTSAFNSLPWDDKNLYQGDSSTVSIPDSNVVWGGDNIKGDFGPIDAAMVPTLGTNRFAFLPASAITVEYSRDGGITWTDYELSDKDKVRLVSGLDLGNKILTIGKITSSSSENFTIDCKLRITITTQPRAIIYTILKKFVILISTGYSTGSNVTIERASFAEPNNFKLIQENVPISGWSGYNVINNVNTIFGGAPMQTSQFQKLRFTFGITGVNENYPKSGPAIQNMYAFGGVGWTTPSNMAKTGQIYSYDELQNVTFPALVKSSLVPASDEDLANKKYVDGKVASINSVSKDYVESNFAAKNHTHDLATENSLFKVSIPLNDTQYFTHPEASPYDTLTANSYSGLGSNLELTTTDGISTNTILATFTIDTNDEYKNSQIFNGMILYPTINDYVNDSGIKYNYYTSPQNAPTTYYGTIYKIKFIGDNYVSINFSELKTCTAMDNGFISDTNATALDIHLNDKSNPHNITPEKIRATPLSHIFKYDNPHKVTAAQVGAATAEHTHDVAEINSVDFTNLKNTSTGKPNTTTSARFSLSTNSPYQGWYKLSDAKILILSKLLIPVTDDSYVDIEIAAINCDGYVTCNSERTDFDTEQTINFKYSGKNASDFVLRLSANSNNNTIYIKFNICKDGFMSGEDKLALSNLQTQVGDISTALDSILTIQNNLLGGNS